ncbi:hypothetical protein T492DRAFT_1125906 [Pavlovales sp. CCMP2436]|nr:hypothetical protein T492DRAFT_1125906 [Pavlovales sp. CCMP2436]
MPSNHEKLLAAQLEEEEKHAGAARARCADNEEELADERARNEDLTRELAGARGESRSLRHELKALSRQMKEQLDAPAQLFSLGLAGGAAAAPPPPAADGDDCADCRLSAAGGDTLETYTGYTEYARARTGPHEPGAPGGTQHAWDGAAALNHDDDESALITEPEVLLEEFEIMDMAVDEDEELRARDLGPVPPRKVLRTPSPGGGKDWGTMDNVLDMFGGLATQSRSRK